MAAAYFYQEKHGKDKKVLVLDNHDDFGGHAKRNEHTIDGDLRITFGGSQSLVEPKHASEVVLDLFRDIGVDLERFEMARHSALDWGGSGTDLMTIATAKRCGALGFTPVAVFDEDNPYIHHFPDGNASVARALVKKMIPNVGKGNTAEELVLSRFNYAELDKSNNTVRIRLNSTVVNARHGGDPESSSEVFVKRDTECWVCNSKTTRRRLGVIWAACCRGEHSTSTEMSRVFPSIGGLTATRVPAQGIP